MRDDREAIIPMHEAIIITDGGPWASHDQACPVCQQRKAVLDLSAGMFQPCWGCQAGRWRVHRRSRFGAWLSRVARRL